MRKLLKISYMVLSIFHVALTFLNYIHMYVFFLFTDFRQRVQSQFLKMMHQRMVCRQQQETSLGLTLVAISILFIVCQSVKLVPDFLELLL